MDLLIGIALIAVVVWLLFILPARRQNQKTSDLMNSLEEGKRVMLTSGIYGTIDTIDDETIELEVSPEVYLSVSKRAIAQVFNDDVDSNDAAVDESAGDSAEPSSSETSED